MSLRWWPNSKRSERTRKVQGVRERGGSGLSNARQQKEKQSASLLAARAPINPTSEAILTRGSLLRLATGTSALTTTAAHFQRRPTLVAVTRETSLTVC